MILTLVAMLSMTTAFAEGEKAANVNNVEAYELNINMNKLFVALDLANDQKEAVADIHHTFASELKFAAQYANNEFRTYLTLLNTTLNNRGIRE